MESYPERFKQKLVQLYESTSVNVVNAGIAGDTIIGMIKEKTSAEIVLLTPNMDAGEENVCLADVYRIWEGFAALGHEVSRMLANGFNHPTATGHEVYALELMNLFPKQVRDETWKEAAVSADIISLD